MKKYDGLNIKIIYLNEDDVIVTSSIVLPDVEIGDGVPGFEN